MLDHVSQTESVGTTGQVVYTLPFLSPNQQCQITERGKTGKISVCALKQNGLKICWPCQSSAK